MDVTGGELARDDGTDDASFIRSSRSSARSMALGDRAFCKAVRPERHARAQRAESGGTDKRRKRSTRTSTSSSASKIPVTTAPIASAKLTMTKMAQSYHLELAERTRSRRWTRRYLGVREQRFGGAGVRTPSAEDNRASFAPPASSSFAVPAACEETVILRNRPSSGVLSVPRLGCGRRSRGVSSCTSACFMKRISSNVVFSIPICHVRSSDLYFRAQYSTSVFQLRARLLQRRLDHGEFKRQRACPRLRTARFSSYARVQAEEIHRHHRVGEQQRVIGANDHANAHVHPPNWRRSSTGRARRCPSVTDRSVANPGERSVSLNSGSPRHLICLYGTR